VLKAQYDVSWISLLTAATVQSKIFHLCLLTLVSDVVMFPLGEGYSDFTCLNESIKFYFNDQNITFFSLYNATDLLPKCNSLPRPHTVDTGTVLHVPEDG
jgi:hypothetical protein